MNARGERLADIENRLAMPIDSEERRELNRERDYLRYEFIGSGTELQAIETARRIQEFRATEFENRRVVPAEYQEGPFAGTLPEQESQDVRLVRAAYQGGQYVENKYDAESDYGKFVHDMFDEMVQNSNSWTVSAIQLGNTVLMSDAIGEVDAQLSKPLAYGLWAWQVRPGGEWDHKQQILDQTPGETTYTPMPGGRGNISHDVWSNIHYGYVGTHANFSARELRIGADVVDLAIHHTTDPGDDLAIRIGIELRQMYPPDQLRLEHIHRAIEEHRDELAATGKIGPHLYDGGDRPNLR